MRALPSLATAKFKRGKCLLVFLNLLQQHDRNGVLVLVGSNLLVPLGEKVVELIQFTAYEDPVAPSELVTFLVEISNTAPCLAGDLNVGGNLVEHWELRPFH